MDDHVNPRIRRLCISVDVEKYSRWDSQDQKQAQDALNGILDRTCQDAGIERTAWSLQPAGDGELAVLPPAIDEARLISGFVRNLAVQLYRHNRTLNDHAAIRLRIAMHFGMTEVAGMGFAGVAPVHAARLRDSPQLREVMTANPDADFALAISQQLYDDHIGHEYPDFQVGDFRRVRVELPDKDFTADAWIYLPPPTRRAGASPLPTVPPQATAATSRDEACPAPAAPDDPGAAAGLNISASTLTIGNIAARGDVNHYYASKLADRDDN
jgi:class 3 adenylate cyclase